MEFSPAEGSFFAFAVGGGGGGGGWGGVQQKQEVQCM